MIQIAVVGGGDAKGGAYALAEEVGEEVARAGAVLLCGGLGGVMEAGAKGAKRGGGTTIGILPGEGKGEANPYIDFKIVTAMSYARNAVIARSADAVIAVGGGYGTLSEIALALKEGKPVVVVRTGGGLEGPLSGIKDGNLHFASTAKEAVQLACRLS
ncbi:MAG: TIGR00725 family protein [Candidatus Hydrothermarchaeota archaeon]